MVRGSPTVGVIEEGAALMEGLVTTTPVVTELVRVTVGVAEVPVAGVVEVPVAEIPVAVVAGTVVGMVFIGSARPETGNTSNVANSTKATTAIAEYMDFFIREF